MINERQVTILETEHFGKLAYVEVGATCVGKIQQTHHEASFERGDEKGMFLFGGSTVIVLGEPGKWTVDSRILDHTNDGVEAYLKMGQAPDMRCSRSGSLGDAKDLVSPWPMAAGSSDGPIVFGIELAAIYSMTA